MKTIKNLTEIISIGDEMLIGKTLNTNAHWLAAKLTENGFKIKHISTISDDKNEIINSLDMASKRSHFVFVSGGLGPTKDDITKNCLCEFFHCELIHFPDVYKHLNILLEKRGVEMIPAHYGQTLPTFKSKNILKS